MPARRVFLPTAPAAVGLALLGPAVAPAAPGGGAPGLRGGAAAVDVTPTEFPVNMAGNFGPNMAHRAHDPLHARALVLDDEANRYRYQPFQAERSSPAEVADGSRTRK